MNEIPAGLKCVGGSVGNIKEAIRGGLNRNIKRNSGNQRNRNSRSIVGETGIAASAASEDDF